VFERFTERARQVVVLAQDEARALKHGYIGTEHLLLGLIREDGRAATTLGGQGVSLESARTWVAEKIGQGTDEPVSAQLPLTPRLKRIFELSLEDADALGHHAIGTQHLLIAVLHEGHGAALQALRDLGAPPEEVWIAAYRQLGVDAPPYVPAGLPSVEAPRQGAPLRERVSPALVAAGGGSFAAGLLVGWLIWG
jgi:ATP-dependent Clp protease ATP-binding subunit ClpC